MEVRKDTEQGLDEWIKSNIKNKEDIVFDKRTTSQIKSATDNVGFADIDNKGDKYIIKSDGKKIYNKKPNDISERQWKTRQFTNSYIFKENDKFTPYLSSLNNLITDTTKEAEISENLYLNEEKFNHIFIEHGEFAPTNLIETANNRDAVVTHPNKQEGVYFLLKKIPGETNFFKIVIEEEN
jgi:hydroxymethylpyrimidine pyrophosphatase-like HAD family hydrolase